MDQTAFKNQIILGTIGKCSENSNMDCSSNLRISSNCEEEIYAPAIALRNITDFEHQHLRQNPRQSTVSDIYKTKFQRTKL